MKILTFWVVFFLLGFIGCTRNNNQSISEISVMTHDSFSIGKEVLARFEQENNVKVKFLKSGNAGAMLNQAILAKNNPLADIFFGVDNTFIGRAKKSGIFISYKSPLLEYVGHELKLDDQNRLLPVDYGDVCLNYDKKWFKTKGIRPPNSLSDIADSEYLNLTVVMNPATSSPGLAFLLATIGRFGESEYLDFWKKLKKNGVLIVNGWKEAYWNHFSASSKGDRPIVVSYASSPAAEVHYSAKKITVSKTKAVTADGTCFRQIEFVGILKGTKKIIMAKKFIDFMLGKAFQEDIPLNMFVFPVNSEAKLPDVFVKHANISKKPVVLSPKTIQANRNKWITDWTEAILR